MAHSEFYSNPYIKLNLNCIYNKTRNESNYEFIKENIFFIWFVLFLFFNIFTNTKFMNLDFCLNQTNSQEILFSD